MIDAPPLSATQFERAVEACGVSVQPRLLAALGRVETDFRPYAIGVNRAAAVSQPRNAPEATATARRLRAEGKNFDAGLLQINSANWSWLGLNEVNVFDICTNIRASATVLTRVSQYNTGDAQRGFTNGYVGKAVAAFQALSQAPSAPPPPPTMVAPQPIPSKPLTTVSQGAAGRVYSYRTR